MSDWEQLVATCKTECEKLGEKGMSFVVMDAAGTELAAGFLGSDQNKAAAKAKGNAVRAAGTDAGLANPADKFGTCIGMCCVFCGCCWCDCLCTKWSIAQSFCTGKLNLLGAVPVLMEDGLVGALACAGAMDCRQDKACAENSLKAMGYARDANGVFSKTAGYAAPEAVDVARG
jgi:hypothetical protein